MPGLVPLLSLSLSKKVYYLFKERVRDWIIFSRVSCLFNKSNALLGSSPNTRGLTLCIFLEPFYGCEESQFSQKLLFNTLLGLCLSAGVAKAEAKSKAPGPRPKEQKQNFRRSLLLSGASCQMATRAKKEWSKGVYAMTSSWVKPET